MTTPASPRRTNPRLSTIELLALCVGLVALTAAAMQIVLKPDPHPVLVQLEERYRQKSSRFGEEWIIRDFFNDRRGGTFLDVGANHYKEENNTYFLETSLGWSGIAIDAIEEFGEDYKRHRPRTRFVAMFASDVADARVKFFVADNHLVSSSNPSFVERHGAAATAREVPTTTLNAVLDQARIQKLDFLSMDIELAEPRALAGFDIARFQPELVCIEAHPDVIQQILDYFARHQYTVVGKYLRADDQNLYFARLRS